MSYLRFTPQEHRAICRRCRDLDFRDCAFRGFRPLLVQLLRDDWPDLTARLARLPRHKLRLLFDHLQAGKGLGAEEARTEDGRLGGLTFEEFGEVARAAQRLPLADESPSSFRSFLLQHFRETPELARKLARLSDRQLQQLYDRVKKPRRWRA